MAGAIPGKDDQDQLNNVFYMLMGADVVSLIVSLVIINHITNDFLDKKVHFFCFIFPSATDKTGL